jgi:hypothetical protein
MTGNIKKMMCNFLMITLLNACALLGGNPTVKIIVNPKNCGWYFVQLKKDSLIKDTNEITVNFVSNGGIRLQQIVISNYNKYNYVAFDSAGNKISSRMKLSGYLSHNGMTFFQFYNPTNKQLAEIDRWSVSNMLCQDIVNVSEKQLDSLTAKISN